MTGSDVIGLIANVAAAIGVVVVIGQLAVAHRQLRAEFERKFVDKYDRIIKDVPLSMMLDDDTDIEHDDRVLRAFYDYFELYEEELYYRKQKKVSAATWKDWWEGISVNFHRPAFLNAWDILDERVTVSKDQSGVTRKEQFALLRQALSAACRGDTYDPRR